MFHFSFEKDAPLTAGEKQMATADITEPRNFPERLRESGDYRTGERYFRAENAEPDSVEEAVDFVRGIFGHTPVRLWLEGEVHDVRANA